MGIKEKVKRRYFTKAQKVSILNEMSLSGLSLSELARKYQISPVVLYKWRKKMDINQESIESVPRYQSVVSELEKSKQEIEKLLKERPSTLLFYRTNFLGFF